MKTAAHVRWECRRGMLELDVLLQGFFARSYSTLSVQDQQVFQRLLACSDVLLLSWLVHKEQPTDPDFERLVEQIIGGV